MSVFTEDVLQRQDRIFEVLRVLLVEEWSLLLLFTIILVHELTVCWICFSVRQNRTSLTLAFLERKTVWWCGQQRRLKTCDVNRHGDRKHRSVCLSTTSSCFFLCSDLFLDSHLSLLSSFGLSVFPSSSFLHSSYISLCSSSALYFGFSFSSFHCDFSDCGFQNFTRRGGVWRRLMLHFQPMVCLKLLWCLPGCVL